MRKSDIAYVPNGPLHYYPVKALEEMTFEEIVKKYLRTCAKANGKVEICSQCKSPCKEGKRAIQLLANQVYNDPPIPLYGGKTLIERAREENMKRRAEEAVPVTKSNIGVLTEALEKAKNEALRVENPVQKEKTEKKNRRYVKIEGWWESSIESGDQVKWVMENMKMTKTQAKKRIYQYKYAHGLTATAEVKTVETPAEVKDVKPVEEVKPIDAGIESKLEKLMHQQDECKKEIEKYQKLLDEAKLKYDEVKKKTDILCSAMDILNDA